MLIRQIKTDRIQAMKSKETLRLKLLTTLMSEASLPGLNDGKRESTDSEVIAVVKKFMKNVQDTIDVVGDTDAEKLAMLTSELEILKGYLPVQLQEMEIREIAQTFATEHTNANVGMFMAHMQKNYNGQFDGRLASGIIREVL